MPKFKLCPDVVHRFFDDEAVIINMSTGAHLSLNCTGSDVLNKLIVEQMKSEDVIQSFLSRFECERDEIINDVNSIICDLEKHSIISQNHE